MPGARALLFWWLLALGPICGCGNHQTRPQAEKFRAALAAFEAAESPQDYERVAAMYQEILDSGVVSGALLFNQGNAYMRAGRRGNAIACYRHAQRYRPRDEQLRASLKYALRDSSPPAKKSPLDHLLFWQDWISYPGKFQATMLLACATFLLATFSFYRTSVVCKWAALVLLAATAILAFSAAYDWWRFEYTRHGVVISDGVIARKGNGDTYEPAFTTSLNTGAEFILLESRPAWIYIQLAEDQRGWIRDSDAAVY